jgi:hypothetical protein
MMLGSTSGIKNTVKIRYRTAQTPVVDPPMAETVYLPLFEGFRYELDTVPMRRMLHGILIHVSDAVQH